MPGFYAEDLAYIHHAGFGDFARDAAPGLLAMLQRAAIRGGLVVDLGCSSGIWARELLRAGYEMLGIDRSAALLDIARAVAPEARFLAASLHEVPLPRCSAVTVIGEGIGYPSGDTGEPPAEALPELFARVFEALVPDGLFVFDVVMRSVRRPMRYHAEREGPDWRVEVVVEEVPRRFLLTRRIRTLRRIEGRERSSEELHRVRTFSRARLLLQLREIGFTVGVHRRYGEAVLPPQRLAFRARKPAEPEPVVCVNR